MGSSDAHSFNPATGKTFGSFGDATAADVQRAIDAASAAFRRGDWSTDPMLRSTALSHMTDVYAARLDDVIDTLCLENGKICMEATFEARILVQRGIAERPKAGLAQRLERARPGPASDPESDLGPLIDKAAVARVNAMVEEAIGAGTVPLVRGGPTMVPHLGGGAFHHPTRLEVTDPAMPIVQREVFGPVQTLQAFDTEDEAIEPASDGEPGLHACVWSRDIDRPIRVARRLEAGLVPINGWANIALEFEEGGFKSSGLGRLRGLASIEDFIEHKQITRMTTVGIR